MTQPYKEERREVDPLMFIRMIQDFEYGRVSRKWRVYSPYENGKTDRPTYFGSETGSPKIPHVLMRFAKICSQRPETMAVLH